MALEHDARLMLSVKEGDEASFALLLARYRTPVMNFIYRMVQNQPIAEELAQEVFLRVYRARSGYAPSAKFTTWLFRIATHLALNSIRDNRGDWMTESLDQEQTPAAAVADRRASVEQELVEEARLVEVRRAVQALPAKQRAAVLMHKYPEMEYAQIAQVLGCSESAVKSLLFRAYEALRGKLAHFAPSASPSASVIGAPLANRSSAGKSSRGCL